MTNYQIWKFVIPYDGVGIQMPMASRILSVAMQHGNMCLWAQVNPDVDKEFRLIRLFGTGQNIPSDRKLIYIGTILAQDGLFVWHVYEELI